jgi:isochorismate hydrolase
MIDKISRRIFLGQMLALSTAVASYASSSGLHVSTSDYAEPEETSLPASDMRLDPQRVALVVIDPQNDFLHEKGVAWGVVGKSVTEHNVVQHPEDLFKAAKSNNLPVFI